MKPMIEKSKKVIRGSFLIFILGILLFVFIYFLPLINIWVINLFPSHSLPLNISEELPEYDNLPRNTASYIWLDTEGVYITGRGQGSIKLYYYQRDGRITRVPIQKLERYSGEHIKQGDIEVYLEEYIPPYTQNPFKMNSHKLENPEDGANKIIWENKKTGESKILFYSGDMTQMEVGNNGVYRCIFDYKDKKWFTDIYLADYASGEKEILLSSEGLSEVKAIEDGFIYMSYPLEGEEDSFCKYYLYRGEYRSSIPFLEHEEGEVWKTLFAEGNKLYLSFDNKVIEVDMLTGEQNVIFKNVWAAAHVANMLYLIDYSDLTLFTYNTKTKYKIPISHLVSETDDVLVLNTDTVLVYDNKGNLYQYIWDGEKYKEQQLFLFT